MPSTFTWLDYSEQERRQMLDVIDLFGERETRDELGLGGVRDAFADLMFPGTSTVQTVAKYFLLVPWIYLGLENKRVSSTKIAEIARKQELALAAELLKNGGGEGVIGRVAKEKLRRLPSSVYWQGLARWGIRLFPGSQEEYHRSLDQFYKSQRRAGDSRQEHEGESAEVTVSLHWHPGLPKSDKNFPQGATLKLSPEEAEYLRERLLTNCAESLMAFLVREHVNVSGAAYVWDLEINLPNRLKREVEHGRNFSEVLHGAQLLYNLMLAERLPWEEMIEYYREELHDWEHRINHRTPDLRDWNRSEFWSMIHRLNPRVSTRARNFINSWIDLVLNSSDGGVIANSMARQLVESREVQLKGKLSRLRNERAREHWNGAAGAQQLNLRWGSARRLIVDIHTGLEVGADA